MARIIGKHVRGAVGDVVFKTYGDLQILQAKPRKYKQSKDTKKAAGIFGMSSSLAREFRSTLSAVITSCYDGTMVFRLNTEVLQSLRYAHDPVAKTYSFPEDSFSRLDGFDFNAKSPFQNNLFVMPDVTVSENILTISLPALQVPRDLKFPAGAHSCKILVGCSLINLKHNRATAKFASFTVPNKKNTTTLPQSWEFELEPGCICITAMSLQYVQSVLAGDRIINTKTFNPAAILNALVLDGEADVTKIKKWPQSKNKEIPLGG